MFINVLAYLYTTGFILQYADYFFNNFLPDIHYFLKSQNATCRLAIWRLFLPYIAETLQISRAVHIIWRLYYGTHVENALNSPKQRYSTNHLSYVRIMV